ncbi:MAG TPA: type II toxin-antitoxin system HicB family antitoxin [Dehalococcoidia bacterium]|nr:type II toxin-antitoxin system HicB family antitoxin [Dehalococcoidia bacterium]
MAKATNGVKYTVILQAETDPEFGGYYNVSVPALPGCFTYGATREEALSSAREAIELYLEDLEASGEPFPEERIEAVGVEV